MRLSSAVSEQIPQIISWLTTSCVGARVHEACQNWGAAPSPLPWHTRPGMQREVAEALGRALQEADGIGIELRVGTNSAPLFDIRIDARPWRLAGTEAPWSPQS
jgi:hypothetical protein